MRRTSTALTGSLLLALALSACGGPSDGGGGSSTPASVSQAASGSSPATTVPSSPVGGSPSRSAGSASGTAGATSSASTPGASASTTASGPEYPGAHAVEEALRRELGVDAEITSRDPETVVAQMSAQGQDLFGPIQPDAASACRQARQATQDAMLDGLVGATEAEAVPREDMGLHTLLLLTFEDEEDWARIAALHESADTRCGLEERATHEEVPTPDGGAPAHVRQSTILGYPESGSNQVLRVSYVPSGLRAVIETTRAPYTGDAPEDLTVYGKRRTPQLVRLLESVEG